jgi:hypothetical protein
MRGKLDVSPFQRGAQRFGIDVKQFITVNERNQSYEKLLLSIKKDDETTRTPKEFPRNMTALVPIPREKREAFNKRANTGLGQLEFAPFRVVIAGPALMDPMPPAPLANTRRTDEEEGQMSRESRWRTSGLLRGSKTGIEEGAAEQEAWDCAQIPAKKAAASITNVTCMLMFMTSYEQAIGVKA